MRDLRMAWAVVATLFALGLVVRSVEPLGLDQGFFACIAQAIHRGALPYRDIWDSKPPGAFYAYAATFALPGPLPMRLWIVEGVVLFTAAVMAAWMAARWWGRAAAPVAAASIVLGMWAPELGGYWARGQAEELMAIPMLVAAFCAHRAREDDRWAFASGLAIGACATLKVPAMVVGAGFVLGLFLRTTTRLAARRSALLVLGALVFPALVVGYFAAHHALGDLVDGAIRYNLGYASLSPHPDLVREAIATPIRALPALAVLAATWFVRAPAERRDEVRWLGTWLAAAFVVVLSQRQLAGYHFLVIVPPLALAAAAAVPILVDGFAAADGVERAIARGASIVAALLFGWMLLTTVRAYAEDAAYLAGRIDRPTYLARFQTGSAPASVQEQLARHLRRDARDDDALLVWGFAPGLYAETGLRPATRFPFHKLMLVDVPLSRSLPGLELRRRDLIARVEGERPRFIVVGTHDQSQYEPTDSLAELGAFPELARIVAADYTLDAKIGPFLAYRRTSAPEGPR